MNITKSYLRSQIDELQKAKIYELDDCMKERSAKIKEKWLNCGSDRVNDYKNFWRLLGNLERSGFKFDSRAEADFWVLTSWNVEGINPVIPEGTYDGYRDKIHLIDRLPAKKAFDYLVAKGIPLKDDDEIKNPPSVIDNLNLNLILTEKNNGRQNKAACSNEK